MMATFVQGPRPVGERPGARRDPREPAGQPLPRHRPHARQLRDTRSTARRPPTTRASSSGSRTAGSTPRSAPTRIWKRAARRVRAAAASTTPSTPSSTSSSPAARPSCPTRSPDESRPRNGDPSMFLLQATVRRSDASRCGARPPPRSDAPRAPSTPHLRAGADEGDRAGDRRRSAGRRRCRSRVRRPRASRRRSDSRCGCSSSGITRSRTSRRAHGRGRPTRCSSSPRGSASMACDEVFVIGGDADRAARSVRRRSDVPP